MSLRSRASIARTSSLVTANSQQITQTSQLPQQPQTPTSSPSPNFTPKPSLSQRAISQTLTSTANLANLLPTGTVLAFQLLTPTFTNHGACDAATRPMTMFLLLILAFSCFMASFTDSFRASNGQVFYGFVTFKGMWLFDYDAAVAAGSGQIPDLSKHKVKFIDWVHAVLSVFVFAGVALRDKNVVGCFYPRPDHEIQEVLDIVPIGIGVIGSLLFVIFPSRRHGIGYPVTSES